MTMATFRHNICLRALRAENDLHKMLWGKVAVGIKTALTGIYNHPKQAL